MRPFGVWSCGLHAEVWERGRVNTGRQVGKAGDESKQSGAICSEERWLSD